MPRLGGQSRVMWGRESPETEAKPVPGKRVAGAQPLEGPEGRE